MIKIRRLFQLIRKLKKYKIAKWTWARLGFYFVHFQDETLCNCQQVSASTRPQHSALWAGMKLLSVTCSSYSGSKQTVDLKNLFCESFYQQSVLTLRIDRHGKIFFRDSRRRKLSVRFQPSRRTVKLNIEAKTFKWKGKLRKNETKLGSCLRNCRIVNEVQIELEWFNSVEFNSRIAKKQTVVEITWSEVLIALCNLKQLKAFST